MIFHFCEMKQRVHSDRRLVAAQLQLLVSIACSTYQRPWLLQFQGLSLLAVSNHKVSHHLTQHLIMCCTTKVVILVLTPTG